jgi:RimJ/RimL family protein N-acetyltransferase
MDVADDAIFTYLRQIAPARWTFDDFSAYIDSLVRRPGWHFLAMVQRDTGRPVGLSSYNDIRPEHRGLEIGSTWIGRAFQGTNVNPEAKYLMLRHAFEDWDAIRVQLKTDRRNLRSRRAIEKLGAVREGILRKHMLLPDGYQRDSVMYSITDDEWPDVRERLVARLGYVP